jgi:hypothetical protein
MLLPVSDNGRMGSKFLEFGDEDVLQALQTGTVPINIVSCLVQSLSPSLPVKADAARQLTSGLIQTIDCGFVPVISPLTDDLDMGGNAITNIGRLDSNAGLNLGTADATGVTIGKPTTATVVAGKGYVLTARPIMSGGFSMITNTTVQNTTTETNMVGAGAGSLSSAANSISAGNSSKMEAAGSVTIAGGSHVLTLRLYGGPTGTGLLATYPITLQTLTGTPPPWRLQTIFTVKSVGVAGTVQINSTFTVNDASPSQLFVNQTLATIDTTAANAIRMTAQWSTANPSNVFITNQLMSHSIYVV